MVTLEGLFESVCKDNLRVPFPTSEYLQSSKEHKTMSNFRLLSLMKELPFVHIASKPPVHMHRNNDVNEVPLSQEKLEPTTGTRDVRVKQNTNIDTHTSSSQIIQPPSHSSPNNESITIRTLGGYGSSKDEKSRFSNNLWTFFPEVDWDEIAHRISRKEYDADFKLLTRSYVKLREECAQYISSEAIHTPSYTQHIPLPSGLVLHAICTILEISLDLIYLNPTIFPIPVHRAFRIVNTSKIPRESLRIVIRETSSEKDGGVMFEKVDETYLLDAIEHVHDKPKVKYCKELINTHSCLASWTVEQVKEGLMVVMFEKLI